MPFLLRAATAAGLLLVGGATGLAVVVTHEIAWVLPLGLGATLLTAYALPAGWWTRLAFAVGFDVVLAWLVGPSADGGYLVSSTLVGYVVVGLGLVLLVAGIATLPRPGSRRVVADREETVPRILPRERA